MSRLKSVEEKLNKIKKAISNNGIDFIYIFVEQGQPVRFDLIYEKQKKIEHIYCYSFEEYLKIKEKYNNIKMLEFIGIEKPEFDDVVVIAD